MSNLRKLLDDATRGPHSVPNVSRIVKEGNKRRQRRRAGAFLVGLAASTALILVGASFFGAGSSTRPSAESTSTEGVTETSSSDPSSEGDEFSRRNQSQEYVVGTGILSGVEYELKVSRAEFVSEEGSMPALCFRWSLGSAATGSDCGNINEVQLGKSLGLIVDETRREEGKVFFYGFAPGRTSEVEVVLKDGSTLQGDLLGSVSQLGFPIKFFVGHAALGEPVSIVAKDREGNVVAEREFPHI